VSYFMLQALKVDMSWSGTAVQQCVLMMSRRCKPFKYAPQEYKEAAKAEASTGIQLIPDESNIYMWKAVIQVCHYGTACNRHLMQASRMMCHAALVHTAGT
jgi:hypothetical protein